MSINITIKRKTGPNKWSGVPLEDTADMTLEAIALKYDGQEVVMEWSRDNERGYFCGTESWKAHFLSRGARALTFPEMVAHLRAKQSPLLTRQVPTSAVARVFPGAELQAVLF